MLMATTNVLGTVYETLLCSPGMNEAVKIDVKMSRKAVLFIILCAKYTCCFAETKPKNRE